MVDLVRFNRAGGSKGLRSSIARIGDGLAALWVGAGFHLQKASQEIAVARLHAGTPPPDVRLADPEHGLARGRPFLQQPLHPDARRVTDVHRDW